MARVHEAIDIPDAARVPKPRFPTRPTPEQLREMKDYIARTKTPWLWDGHTHTEPQVGARIQYIGEFGLDEANAAPCPCCTPNHAKYWRRGLIAWFPDDHLVRFMGDKCFKRLNPEGHDAAWAEYRREEAERADEEYLLQNLHVVPTTIGALQYALPAFAAIDTVRRILSERIHHYVGGRLWEQVRNGGDLRVEVTRREIFRRPDNTEDERTVRDFRVYSTIRGFEMLNPQRRNLESRARTTLNGLLALNVPVAPADVPAYLQTMDARARRRLVTVMRRAVETARELTAEAEDLRRFVSVETVATLNGWSRAEGSPISFFLRLNGTSLFIGKTEYQGGTLQFPQDFDLVFRALPDIGQVNRPRP